MHDHDANRPGFGMSQKNDDSTSQHNSPNIIFRITSSLLSTLQPD
jgi:hypothetical protein